jgi:hypothetical protein
MARCPFRAGAQIQQKIRAASLAVDQVALEDDAGTLASSHDKPDECAQRQ